MDVFKSYTASLNFQAVFCYAQELFKLPKASSNTLIHFEMASNDGILLKYLNIKSTH